jgi:hypothetical protein
MKRVLSDKGRLEHFFTLGPRQTGGERSELLWPIIAGKKFSFLWPLGEGVMSQDYGRKTKIPVS